MLPDGKDITKTTLVLFMHVNMKRFTAYVVELC